MPVLKIGLIGESHEPKTLFVNILKDEYDRLHIHDLTPKKPLTSQLQRQLKQIESYIDIIVCRKITLDQIELFRHHGFQMIYITQNPTRISPVGYIPTETSIYDYELHDSLKHVKYREHIRALINEILYRSVAEVIVA